MGPKKTVIPYASLVAVQKGGLILKFGRHGEPHFRHFNVTRDFQHLVWVSKKKAEGSSRVKIPECTVLVGQRTKVFDKNKRPDLKNLSFSLKDNKTGKTVDVACKDQKEFDIWVGALSYIQTYGPPSQEKMKEFLANQSGEERRNQSHSRGNTKAFVNEDAKQDDLPTKGNAKNQLKDRMKDANDIYVWGYGGWGQLGLGNDGNREVPSLVESLLGGGIEKVCCGADHTVALSNDHGIYVWGNGRNGRLGTGNCDHVLKPMQLMKPGSKRMPWKFAQVACGHMHTIAVTHDGSVFTWGCNIDGQLGLSHNDDMLTPQHVERLEGHHVRKLAAGLNFSACISDSGGLYSWGSGESGCLGNGTNESSSKPVLVDGFGGDEVVEVSAGDFHMAALTKRRELFTWGWGGTGVLGHGDFESSNIPVLVQALQGKEIRGMSSGAAHMAAVILVKKIDARIVYTWGACKNGQLGHPELKGAKAQGISTPKLIPSLRERAIEVVACGACHSAALSENGEVWVWGDGRYGQLAGANHGNPDPIAYKPVKVGSLDNKEVRTVVCGGRHTCVMLAKRWINDHETSACMECSSNFTLINRRHHCRNCGGIFCNRCTGKRYAVLKLGHIEPVRVCNNCYNQLSRN